MSSLMCPRCAASLETHQADPEFNVGLCNACGGIWLGVVAHRTVEAALSSAAAQATTHQAGFAAVHPAPDPDLSCPECDQKMARFFFGDVNVDHCATHGTWYDSHELDEVASVLRGRGIAAARDVDGDPSDVPVITRGGEQADEPAPDPEDDELREMLVTAPSAWDHVGEVSQRHYNVLSLLNEEGAISLEGEPEE
jgi:Zn-finger nucleic acid-binding protein